MAGVFLVAVLLALAPCAVLSESPHTPSDGLSAGTPACESLGFTGLGLCSDCDQLASYVKDASLEAECRQCCVQDQGEAGQAKFSEAVLEVCGRRVSLYPDVLAFIDEKASKFPNLKISYRIGAAPKLVMKNSASGEQEVVRIDNWKTENVEQFLQAKLTLSV